MQIGEKVICQKDDWYNAFGEKSMALHMGMRLTVTNRRNINGSLFLAFEETPDDHLYLMHGFAPLRAYN